MKTNILLVAAFGAGCIAISWLAPQGSAQQSDHQTTETVEQTTEGGEATSSDIDQGSFWMDQKLRLSKDVLTGLANADFETIGKSAEVIRGLNRVEKFVHRAPEGYRDQLRQFNMANNALIRASREENLEGATLAFNQLTVSCVNCHRHLHETE